MGQEISSRSVYCSSEGLGEGEAGMLGQEGHPTKYWSRGLPAMVMYQLTFAAQQNTRISVARNNTDLFLMTVSCLFLPRCVPASANESSGWLGHRGLTHKPGRWCWMCPKASMS